MSIYSIKYKGNENISDKDTLKLYIISGILFVSIPTIIGMLY